MTTQASTNGRTNSKSNRQFCKDEPRTCPKPKFKWDEDDYPSANYAGLAILLAQSGDLYRTSSAEGGLLGLSRLGTPLTITKGPDLFPLIVDRVHVQVVKDNKPKGGKIDATHLNAMLRSEAFLREFRTVDQISKVPLYLPDFSLTKPGYNDGGPGFRVLGLHETPLVSDRIDATSAFLDEMQFASNADRTNAVAFALTVTLCNRYPGSKPIAIVTATKSHCGKDTIIAFAAGVHKSTAISYQRADWAFEKNFVMALKAIPDSALLVVENARLEHRQSYIASAFLERYITDAQPLLSTSGTGKPVCRRNELVTAISTNFGRVSEDLMNRGLPIHLDAVGDMTQRDPKIGNPKLEYLPENKDRIAAELRGMIERWKKAGKPLDAEVRHPFTEWARTVGGILRVNGFTEFLANYGARRTMDDPVRRSLGLLGATEPKRWQSAADWALLAVQLGLHKDLISPNEQDSTAGRARGMGVVLSSHRDETLFAETENSRLTMRLEKSRKRIDGSEPQVRYRFVTLTDEVIPEDAEPTTQ